MFKSSELYGGKLIEVKYTKGVSSSAFIDQLNSITITPDIRRATLKRLIDTKKFLDLWGLINPISAIIAENTYYEKNGRRFGFDGFWSSSLTDPTASENQIMSL